MNYPTMHVTQLRQQLDALVAKMQKAKAEGDAWVNTSEALIHRLQWDRRKKRKAS